MKQRMLLICCFVCCLDFGSSQETRIGSPDDSQIERPCGAVYDVNCVREYLYQHSKCKKTYGPAPDPYIKNEIIYNVPLYNLTISTSNNVIGGLNGRIDEFYINKDTDRLVIAIEFRNLSMSTTRGLFRFHRRAKEPVVTQAPAFVVYASVIITVVVPNIKDLQLDIAEYTTFSNDADPPFGFGPEILAGVTDPQVLLTVAEFPSRPSLNIQELFLSDSTFYPLSFIQYNLCDFGLKAM